MKDTFDQFMWGFQRHFRIGVRRRIEQALSTIGLPTDVRVILVGFATGDYLRHPICVEPEDGPLSPDHLSAVLARAAELYQADPESQMSHTDARHHGLRQRGIFHKCRANAIIEAIEASGALKGFTIFASGSSPIDGYEVHTCVGIPSGAFDALPAFDESVVDRIYVGRSLQHQVIEECLRRAGRALYLPDPGDDWLILGATEEIVKAAADRFVDGTVWRMTKWRADLFRAVNDFASLAYERDEASGHLSIAQGNSLEDRLRVRFHKSVPLHEPRSMRKLLQVSDASMPVLADSEYAYGFGYSEPAEDVIDVLVSGHAKWELSVNGASLLQVSYGHATLANRPLDFGKFRDTARRTVGDVDVDRIWEIVESAQSSGHGTTIVVSDDPEAEAARLSGEALQIVPDRLCLADIIRLGSVDGAIILGPDGRCHAFGVILDGMATGSGDRARGSRFNSAVRYQETVSAGSMLIVVSEDGSVDMIPQLMPRVHRDEVEEVVRTFCAYCEADHVDGEEFGRLYRELERLVFYLNDEQCRRVNESHDKEMDRRRKSGWIVSMDRHIQPDPEMNGSYFWDDA